MAHSGGGPRKGFECWAGRERGLNVGLDALLFLPAKARATEEGGGDYISEQRTISDCESAAHIGKTGWEKRRARRDGCSDA